jgi:hypothetical protein
VRRTSTASRPPSTVTAGVLTGLFVLLAGAGVALAPSAAAVDDPTRPDARVTHGPSCRPGGLVVEVTAGTAPYVVRLATTRSPGGEDETAVAPGATVVLRSDDVDWGETIDGRLEYTARDGSGVTFVDELDNYSFTRPTQEDCDAVNDPTQVHPSPPPSSGPAAETPPADEETDAPSSTPVRTPGGAPATETPERTADRSSEPDETQAGGVVPGPGSSGRASSAQVAPGDSVTVHGTGFLPGERVVIQLSDGPVLGSTTAAPDGSVRVEVRIPERTESGPAMVTLVGDDSEFVAGVKLQVAALSAPAGDDDGTETLLPLVAAAVALVATVAWFFSVAGRQWHTAGRRRPLNGSA